ncbi:hypothetical protein Tco_1284978 [Tanacetum coccineum]
MASLSRRLCGRETAHALVEKKGKANDKYYGKLILDLGNEVRFSVEQGTAAMEKLVERLGNTKDKVECKKLEKELEEERLSNTFLRMQNERVERDLYWTRVQAHEFYQEMIRRGFMFEERPNEAINVPSAPMTQAAIRRMIKDSVDAAIAVERARQANVRNDASRSGTVRGDVELRRWFEKTQSVFEISECVKGKKVKFVAVILEGPALTWWKTKVATIGLETVNQMPWTEIKMVKSERVKVDAYIRGLTNNIKGEVTSSKPADLNEAVRMAHKLTEQKLQARDARILERKKRKWESFQSGNSSGKGNQKDNSHQTLQNSQKQRNTRAMVTTPTDGKIPLCERCFTRHVGQCTIKCHKCVKVGHKARNRCPKKINQEEAGEVYGRAYAIKDAEP